MNTWSTRPSFFAKLIDSFISTPINLLAPIALTSINFASPTGPRPVTKSASLQLIPIFTNVSWKVPNPHETCAPSLNDNLSGNNIKSFSPQWIYGAMPPFRCKSYVWWYLLEQQQFIFNEFFKTVVVDEQHERN